MAKCGCKPDGVKRCARYDALYEKWYSIWGFTPEARMSRQEFYDQMQDHIRKAREEDGPE